MEGMQYLEHHVAKGTHRAVLYWKIQDGKVYVKESKSWKLVEVPVQFFPDRPFAEIGQQELGGKQK